MQYDLSTLSVGAVVGNITFQNEPNVANSCICAAVACDNGRGNILLKQIEALQETMCRK